jgi:hypothetical protein
MDACVGVRYRGSFRSWRCGEFRRFRSGILSPNYNIPQKKLSLELVRRSSNDEAQSLLGLGSERKFSTVESRGDKWQVVVGLNGRPVEKKNGTIGFRHRQRKVPSTKEGSFLLEPQTSFFSLWADQHPWIVRCIFVLKGITTSYR